MRTLLEVDGLALEQVVQPAGRRDEDVRGACPPGLGGDRNAAVDGGCVELARRKRIELARDLCGQLARRDEDERRRARPGCLETLHDRDREAERLARARRGLGEHVAACECFGKNPRLDREGLVEVALGERARNVRGHAELRERVLHFDSTPMWCPDEWAVGRDPSCSTHWRNRRSQTSRDSGAVRTCTVAAKHLPRVDRQRVDRQRVDGPTSRTSR